MKLPAIVCALLMWCTTAYSQGKDTLSADAAKAILKQLDIDTSKFLSEFSTGACECLDSVSLTDKSSQELSEDISNCIDQQVVAYQATLKIYRSLKSGDAESEILVSSDKETAEYKRYYFEIEEWMMDSCSTLISIAASHNKESEFSMSKDPRALKEYDNGVIAMQQEDYEKARSYFKKALEIDAKFAFAWDNLGLSERKLGNYDDALKAYNQSLEIDPRGHLPLQNIAIVYEYQKKYDKALESYQNISKYYPDDPEAFYGAGRIYSYFLVDHEKALQSMCKAYNIYSRTSSPYRVDAQKQINYLYGEMKKAGNEKRFFEILKENKIEVNSN